MSEHTLHSGHKIQHVHSSAEFGLTAMHRGPAVDSHSFRNAAALAASIAATSVGGVAAGRGTGAEIA